MLKLGGRNIGNAYLGGQKVSRAYLGPNLVWTAAKPLPYDYEVEWIERDCSKQWIDSAGKAAAGGFSIAQYLDGTSIQTMTRPIEARLSATPTAVGGNLAAIILPVNLLWTGVFLGRSSTGGGSYRYSSWYSHAGPQMDIDTFHVQRLVPNGEGTCAI